jgi:hypothetical protein
MSSAALVLLPLIGRANPPLQLTKPLDAAGAISLITGTSVDALSGSLRGYLVHNLPPTLYDASPGWGRTIRVSKVEWRGKGLDVHPETVYKDKNDGIWRQIRFTADNLADTMVFDIRNVRNELGCLRFDVYLSFDARIYYLHQRWETGHKLYDGHSQARMRIKCSLSCEATCRLEPNDTILPDAVVRLRVLKTDLTYDNFVVEHLAGIGGEAAKILGGALKGGLKQWHPSLERALLAKAEAAIVKAGDTKEVHVSLLKLLKSKP